MYPFKLCMVRDGRLVRGSYGIQALFEEDVVSYFDAVTGEALDAEEATAATKLFPVDWPAPCWSILKARMCGRDAHMQKP